MSSLRTILLKCLLPIAFGLLACSCSHVRIAIPLHTPHGGEVEGLRIGARDSLSEMTGFDLGINNHVTNFTGIALDTSHMVEGEGKGIQLGGYNEVGQSKNFTVQLGLANRCNDGDLSGQLGFFNFNNTDQGAQIGMLNHGDFTKQGLKLGILNIAREQTGGMVGFMNLSGITKGFTIGVINETRTESARHDGWTAGLFNHSHNANGSQMGLVNVTEQSVGLSQVGVFNQAKKFRGVQIGLINRAPEMAVGSIQIGLLNLGKMKEGVKARGFPILFRIASPSEK